MFALFIGALFALAVVPSRTMTAEWIPASDSASLPMSKKYRDDLRDRLAKIDLKSVGTKERENIERLKRLLAEPFTDSDPAPVSWGTIFAIISAISLLILFLYKKRSQIIPSAEELRRVREMKYQ